MKINQFFANGEIQKFGPNKDMESFWFDDQERCTDTKLIKTPFVTIQNGEVTSTFCDDEVKRLLSLRYSRHEYRRNIYYKNHGYKNYHQAYDICAQDGTSLPVPRSGLINKKPSSMMCGIKLA